MRPCRCSSFLSDYYFWPIASVFSDTEKGIYVPSLAQRWIAVGAALAAIGVALGALGAHWLDDLLKGLGYDGDDLTRRLDIFRTAVHYQMLHAIGLVVVGLALAQRASAWWRLAAWAFLFGVLLFSGLLKALTFAGPQWNWLGGVVPIGGVLMIAGWIALAIGAAHNAPLDRGPPTTGARSA
jgi:uncharacterized membrane protein YgdD (TMEM256/DUF423 family)